MGRPAVIGYVLVNRVSPGADAIALGADEFAGPGILVNNPDASGETIEGAGSLFPRRLFRWLGLCPT